MDQTQSQSPSTLVHKREDLLFALCIVASISIALWLLFSIIGAMIFIALGLLTLFSHAISMAHIQVNGVRLRESQFPEIYQKVVELSEKMKLPKVPEVYIVESGGILNAFATKVFGFFGKNMVILYSDYVEIGEEKFNEEVDFVIAHELAHIKRNHVFKQLLVFPAMWVPFLGLAYSRSCEYTCDRMAAHYTGNPERAVSGLLVFAAGKRLFQKINLSDYLIQYNEKKGFLTTLMELLSTHPPLPKRIHAIEEFTGKTPTVAIRKDRKHFWAIIIILLFIVPVLFSGLVFAGYKGLDSIGFFEDMMFPESSPVMDAAYEGDVALVEEFLQGGTDPNEVSEYGESLLDIAAYNSDPEMVEMLLEYGADPNIQGELGWTPLMSAVINSDIVVAKILLDAGADPTLEDVEGTTAFILAEENEFSDMLELLEQY